MEETKQYSVSERFAQMILTEAIMLAAVLLAAVAIRFVFADRGGDIITWYKEHVCVDTDVNEVISPEESHAF